MFSIILMRDDFARGQQQGKVWYNILRSKPVDEEAESELCQKRALNDFSVSVHDIHGLFWWFRRHSISGFTRGLSEHECEALSAQNPADAKQMKKHVDTERYKPLCVVLLCCV